MSFGTPPWRVWFAYDDRAVTALKERRKEEAAYEAFCLSALKEARDEWYKKWFKAETKGAQRMVKACTIWIDYFEGNKNVPQSAFPPGLADELKAAAGIAELAR